MFLIGAIGIVRAILLFVTQILGGIAAAALVKALFHGDLNVSTTLSSGTTIAQGVLIEMLLTAQLCFTIFMLAAEKHQGNFIAPVGIGISLFVSELVGKSTSLIFLSETKSRRLLDRRLIESCALIRPGSSHPQVQHNSMDLLGWAPSWRHFRRAPL